LFLVSLLVPGVSPDILKIPISKEKARLIWTGDCSISGILPQYLHLIPDKAKIDHMSWIAHYVRGERANECGDCGMLDVVHIPGCPRLPGIDGEPRCMTCCGCYHAKRASTLDSSGRLRVVVADISARISNENLYLAFCNEDASSSKAIGASSSSNIATVCSMNTASVSDSAFDALCKKFGDCLLNSHSSVLRFHHSDARTIFVLPSAIVTRDGIVISQSDLPLPGWCNRNDSDAYDSDDGGQHWNVDAIYSTSISLDPKCCVVIEFHQVQVNSKYIDVPLCNCHPAVSDAARAFLSPQVFSDLHENALVLMYFFAT